ncbi:MAG: hypothetical protein EDM75_09695 [Chlorobiota bacterium]|nr:MAG: hypothetical protein EDM75_09695 [Chlorobiota bacterium]
MDLSGFNGIPDPHPSRLSPERHDYRRIIDLHREACMAKRDTYRDPATGYSVFTAFYHLRRGHCCNSGCRHCPFIDRGQ